MRKFGVIIAFIKAVECFEAESGNGRCSIQKIVDVVIPRSIRLSLKTCSGNREEEIPIDTAHCSSILPDFKHVLHCSFKWLKVLESQPVLHIFLDQMWMNPIFWNIQKQNFLFYTNQAAMINNKSPQHNRIILPSLPLKRICIWLFVKTQSPSQI